MDKQATVSTQPSYVHLVATQKNNMVMMTEYGSDSPGTTLVLNAQTGAGMQSVVSFCVHYILAWGNTESFRVPYLRAALD